MTDYTNDRWHVAGTTVTHDDFPGMKWDLAFKNNAEAHASSTPNRAWTHAARAWLAAQPKPTIKVGMRIEATLRGGAVVIGEVTAVSDCGDWTVVRIGSSITCYIDVEHKYEGAGDITDWREVTA